MNNISAIVTASYATSKEADLVGKDLKKWLDEAAIAEKYFPPI